jgi:hypothetical protein
VDGSDLFSAEPTARAILQAATLDQLEALHVFSNCTEWRTAVLDRLSCRGVDDAELAAWPEGAWNTYYTRLEVCSLTPLVPYRFQCLVLLRKGTNTSLKCQQTGCASAQPSCGQFGQALLFFSFFLSPCVSATCSKGGIV